MIASAAPPQWILHPKRDPERARELAVALNAPLTAAHALVNRGFTTPEAALRFLEPTLDDLHDPFELMDLRPAMVRLLQAVDGNERVLIHGDYDVDGITATFLLFSVLRDLGARAEYRIPHRTKDGYGLSLAAIEDAQRRGCTLIVTVDCGITAIEPVARGNALGIDTIITDHHEPAAELPSALAIVNPHRPGDGYPFKWLAGVGVTFKLVEAILRERGGIERAREYLDVVALGTIADVVPLVGENRVFARHGLARMNQGPRLGLRSLIEVAGMGGKAITSGQVAFVLAPRINAAGRMGNAEQGLRLLLARDSGEAHVLAESLEEDNERRRRFDEEALIQASARVESELAWPQCASILLWSDDWHPGVIGIVASRLVERYHRPTILVAVDGPRGRGSGRSLPGLDLNQLLGSCGDLLESYGGHAFAAGLTVARERLPDLRERFEQLVRERLSPEDCVPRLVLDGEAAIGDCTLETIEWLERLSPHGLGNPEPVFVASGVTVESATTVGGGKHLKMSVRDASGRADAIGFGLGPLAAGLTRASRCDIAFVPSLNQWMGETRVQLRLKGVRPS